MSAASETVAFLLKEIPPQRRWRHAYTPPAAPLLTVSMSPGGAQRRLRAIINMLEPCQGRVHDLCDPVVHARVAIDAKVMKNPGDLEHSAKLYRAICDLDLAATLPQLSEDAELLAAAVEELRRLSGWSAED
jgi:hypothetical protein